MSSSESDDSGITSSKLTLLEPDELRLLEGVLFRSFCLGSGVSFRLHGGFLYGVLCRSSSSSSVSSYLLLRILLLSLARRETMSSELLSDDLSLARSYEQSDDLLLGPS